MVARNESFKGNFPLITDGQNTLLLIGGIIKPQNCFLIILPILIILSQNTADLTAGLAGSIAVRRTLQTAADPGGF